ncbi:MAG: helix-turn-helix transcriptional regulator [Acidobacteria bacterium]|nr:helix-turn-helix transcriptional regulator [Acidobacteriota bacterium]
MTIVGVAADSTSACGAMLVRPIREPALVGLILIGLGTSTAGAVPVPTPLVGLHASTSAGHAVSDVRISSAALTELRRRSGLTWEQISRLFGVSRRALHFWASGKAMTPANEEHLQRVLAVLRRIDRGSPETTRAALVQGDPDGVSPFDLLGAGRYEQAASAATAVPQVDLSSPRWPSQTVLSGRTPRPPADLVNALQDRPNVRSTTARSASSVKVRRG